ncbi:MAG: uncharacterized protein KVP18_004237 [Porospora cf. gigantea A]|uniref:uncharacterized protein n=2 Tax=Porospora cf. gigantea A TaxID=2853593 RepID=UPI0035598692|nr:MAG: hypothetical protein KVP18_004237 [Porospora cf. gigantea A]
MPNQQDWRERYANLMREYTTYAQKAEVFMDWCMQELAQVYGTEHFRDLFQENPDTKGSLPSSTGTGPPQSPKVAQDHSESMNTLDAHRQRVPVFRLNLSRVGAGSWLSGETTQGEFYADVNTNA